MHFSALERRNEGRMAEKKESAEVAIRTIRRVTRKK